MVAWGPIPLVVENTRPLQVPFSIWVQRSPYFLSFSLSCLPYILAGVLCLALDLAPGCKTLISKNAISIGDHRPLAAMSSLAPSSRIVSGRRLSPVHGWSMGSTFYNHLIADLLKYTGNGVSKAIVPAGNKAAFFANEDVVVGVLFTTNAVLGYISNRKSVS